MALPPVLRSIVGWLRAGYPEGVPQVDYIPLFALLASQLTDEDIAAIAERADERVRPGIGRRDPRRPRRRATDHKPLEVDVARVRARLAAGGWPLAPVTAADGSTSPAG